MAKRPHRSHNITPKDIVPKEHRATWLERAVLVVKRIFGIINPPRDIALVLLGVVLGGGLSWLGNYYYYKKALHDAEVDKQEAVNKAEANRNEEIARYVVAAMLPQHPVKDSNELRNRVDQYLDALRRTKADRRGTPVYREDGTIGVDWSVNLVENFKSGLNDDLRSGQR